MSELYILDYELPNKFKVNIIAEARSEKAAIAAAGQILGALQNTSGFEVHPAIKMLNQQTPVKSEHWKINQDRRTNGRKQFLVYYITNNTLASKIEYGKGIKSAYLNFKDAQNKFNKGMDDYKINIFNAIVIIDTAQQVSMVKQKQFNENQQEYEMDASKALNALSQQARQLRQMGSNLNILAVKQNSLYWIYRVNGGFNTKVVFSNPNQIDKLQYVIKGFKKRQIDADIVLVSRDFIDTMKMKGVNGYKLYESIRGNLAVGVIAGTGIGQELKDPNIVDGMFEIKVGDVWSKQRSVQTWKNIIGPGSTALKATTAPSNTVSNALLDTSDMSIAEGRYKLFTAFRLILSMFKH